jgi:hypothetical protein
MVYAKIVNAISEPSLARNAQGKVRVALLCLPDLVQKRLACDFVEHALSIIAVDEPQHVAAHVHAVASINRFLQGEASIEEVRHISNLAIASQTVVCAPSITVGPAGSVLQLLLLCCCQRELESRQLTVRNRWQPSVFVVAREACTAVASHAGQTTRVSCDSEPESAARLAARAAGEREAHWQLVQILEAAQQ